MKKTIAIILLLFIGIISVSAQSFSPWAIGLELDMYLGIKFCTEYRFTEHTGLYGSIGINITSLTQVTYNLFFIYHFMDFTKPFQINLEAGFLQCVFDVIATQLDLEEPVEPYSYWNPGLALSFLYKSGIYQIGIRGGAVVKLGYDNHAWEEPEIMPNVAIEILNFL